MNLSYITCIWFFYMVLYSHLIKIEHFQKKEISNDIPCTSSSHGTPSKISETLKTKNTPMNDLREIKKILVYPFNFLKVKKSQSSIGKCWMFHLDNLGHLSGFLFPSGYRVYNSKSMLLVGGRFFMENRNFHSTKRGLMASKIPMKPQIGYNKCKFVIINTL